MYTHFFTYLTPDIIVMINFILQLRPHSESLVVMETFVNSFAQQIGNQRLKIARTGRSKVSTMHFLQVTTRYYTQSIMNWLRAQ